jgi:hypothetical protein
VEIRMAEVIVGTRFPDSYREMVLIRIDSVCPVTTS